MYGMCVDRIYIRSFTLDYNNDAYTYDRLYIYIPTVN